MTCTGRFPPCPTCNAEVTNLVAEGVVEESGHLDSTRAFIREPFKLIPCGHELREFTEDATATGEQWAEIEQWLGHVGRRP